MKTIVLLLFLLDQIYAFTLQEVLQSVRTTSKFQSLEYKQAALVASNKAQMSSDPASLSFDFGYAKEALGEDGLEYQLSLSQDLKYPLLERKKERYSAYTLEYYKAQNRLEQNLLLFEGAQTYHLACIDKERYEEFEKIVQNQKDIVAKLQKAFLLGEIAKRVLLFHQLQEHKLVKELEEYRHSYEQTLLVLEEQLENHTLETLACHDLYTIAPLEKSTEFDEHQEYKILHAQEKLTALDLDFAQSVIPQLSYTLGYEKELDKDRYGIILSIPLQFWGSQTQQQQVSFLNQKRVLRNKVTSFAKSYKIREEKYRQTLRNRYENYIRYEKEILPLSKELQELSLFALYEGEGSVLESLDALRTYQENLIEFLEIKKEYYTDLFMYYKSIGIYKEER